MTLRKLRERERGGGFSVWGEDETAVSCSVSEGWRSKETPVIIFKASSTSEKVQHTADSLLSCSVERKMQSQTCVQRGS